MSGGFRLMARKGTSVQEVFVGCHDLSREALEEATSNAIRL